MNQTQQLLADRVAFYRRAFDYFAATPPSQLHPSRVVCMLHAYATDDTITEAEVPTLHPLVLRTMDVHGIPHSVDAVVDRMAFVRWHNKGTV